MSTAITHTRHYSARVHQTWAVAVPDEVLTNPLYFDESGEPTPDFDAWVCDNGRMRYEEVEPLNDWELNFDSERIS